MGVEDRQLYNMQCLILFGLVAVVAGSGPLVLYPNGAVAPFDPNNAAATAGHFAALAEAGQLVVNPYNVYATNLVQAYAPTLIGRRKRDASLLVTSPNGAVAPLDPNVAAATATHYAAKAAAGVYPFAGAESVHPAGAAVVPSPLLIGGVYPY